MTKSHTRKVLVVEDNELNMRLFCDLLDAFGFETFQCRDGAKAVEIARQELPDLIIMDIQLPEVSGLDIMTRSRTFRFWPSRHLPCARMSSGFVKLAVRGTFPSPSRLQPSSRRLRH